MSKNLLEQLPLIIADGRHNVERILETQHLVTLETREWVLPAKDSAILNWIKADTRRRRMNAELDMQPNRLIHGDDLLVMAALLAEDKAAPSLQGKLDLIYMECPFCFGEDFQVCSIASYLRMLVPRLLLMWELLSDRGLICVRVGAQAKYYVDMIVCDMFGRQSLAGHLIRAYAISDSTDASGALKKFRDTVLIFGKRDKGSLQGNGNSGDATPESAHSLEAIMLASTQRDSIVADFSGGSGNTAALAERLGRRWITSDIGNPACTMMRTRLIEQNAEPFLYQAIDTSQGDAAKILAGHAFRISDLSQIVLLLYGAEPLPSEDAPDWHRGQMLGAGSKTLVLVEPPNALVGLTTLKKAIKQRDSLTEGWDRLVVLGWKFESSIEASIKELNDHRLEVLAIPSDLLDTLKKNANADKLKGQVRFVDVHV
jgi:adenine-specific DNA-methyltransferase